MISEKEFADLKVEEDVVAVVTAFDFLLTFRKVCIASLYI